MPPLHRAFAEAEKLSVLSSPSSRRQAFSLIELLTVMAILSLMAFLVAPSISSIMGAQGMTRAVNDVSSVLELSRTEAMARRTYVYVGFVNSTNDAGVAELRISAACSPDGSTATSGLLPIARVSKVQNVWQTNYSGLPQNVKTAATNAMRDQDYVSQINLPGVSFVNGKQTFSGSMLVISPQGELLPSPNSAVFQERANVGLIGMNGTSPKANEGGVVTIDGGSGVVGIIRP